VSYFQFKTIFYDKIDVFQRKELLRKSKYMTVIFILYTEYHFETSACKNNPASGVSAQSIRELDCFEINKTN